VEKGVFDLINPGIHSFKKDRLLTNKLVEIYSNAKMINKSKFISECDLNKVLIY
jgi:hypothetical protein